MHISIEDGIAHTPDGAGIDLLEVQVCCVSAFQATGDQRDV